MSTQKTLSFVVCQNPDHIGKEGWQSRELYYAGSGVYKCDSCGEEFTHEQVQAGIKREYKIRLQELQKDFQISVARLWKDQQDNLDKLKNIDKL